MSTRDLVAIALFAAITAALGVFPPLTIPVIGVPVTAQSMGALLAGAIIGSRRGGLAILVFLLLVAAGLPLLAGGRGGFGVFLGPSGGFLLAWPLVAFTTGLLYERYWSRLGFASASLILLVTGIVLLYPIGIAWIALIAGVPILGAATASAAFIPGDIVKIAITAAVSLAIRRAYPMITPRTA